MERVAVRALRNHTAEVLRRVQAGEILEVTEYGRPVARLVPLTLDRWDQLKAMGQVEPAVEHGSMLALGPVEPGQGVPLPTKVLAKIRAQER